MNGSAVRRHGARWLALLVLTFACTLGLVFAPSGQGKAYAFDPTSAAPVVVGGGAKFAPRLLTSLSPVGLVINTGLVGMALYSSRDTWLPWVQETLLGGDSEVPPGEPSQSGSCTRQLDSITLEGPPYRFHIEGSSGGSSAGTCASGVSNSYFGQIRIESRPFGASDWVLADGFSMTSVAPYQFEAVSDSLGETCGELRVVWRGAVMWQGSCPLPPAIQTTDTRVECRSGLDGSMLPTIGGTVTGQPDKLFVPSCEDAYPGQGAIPETLTVRTGTPGNTREVLRVIQDTTVRDEYADCFTMSGLVCRVEVWFAGDPCVMGASGCTDWWLRRHEKPGRYDCKFGPYSVPWKNCDVLRYAYVKPHAVEKTKPNGEPELNPDPSPSPNPNPGGEPLPTTGPNPTTPGAPPVTGETDPDSQNCWGEGWSWNPVSWVYVPTKCALTWAFVPSSGFLDAKFSELREDMAGTTPGKYLDEFEGLTFGTGLQGCEGIRVAPPMPGDGSSGNMFDLRLGEACSGKMAQVAGMVRIGITVAALASTFLACANALLGGFGWRLKTAREHKFGDEYGLT